MRVAKYASAYRSRAIHPRTRAATSVAAAMARRFSSRATRPRQMACARAMPARRASASRRPRSPRNRRAIVVAAAVHRHRFHPAYPGLIHRQRRCTTIAAASSSRYRVRRAHRNRRCPATTLASGATSSAPPKFGSGTPPIASLAFAASAKFDATAARISRGRALGGAPGSSLGTLRTLRSDKSLGAYAFVSAHNAAPSANDAERSFTSTPTHAPTARAHRSSLVSCALRPPTSSRPMSWSAISSERSISARASSSAIVARFRAAGASVSAWNPRAPRPETIISRRLSRHASVSSSSVAFGMSLGAWKCICSAYRSPRVFARWPSTTSAGSRRDQSEGSSTPSFAAASSATRTLCSFAARLVAGNLAAATAESSPRRSPNTSTRRHSRTPSRRSTARFFTRKSYSRMGSCEWYSLYPISARCRSTSPSP